MDVITGTLYLTLRHDKEIGEIVDNARGCREDLAKALKEHCRAKLPQSRGKNSVAYGLAHAGIYGVKWIDLADAFIYDWTEWAESEGESNAI